MLLTRSLKEVRGVGRGSLIGSLFKEHSGFELFSVAD